MKHVKHYIADALIVIASLSVVTGVALMHIPSAFIVGGILLAFFVVIIGGVPHGPTR